MSVEVRASYMGWIAVVQFVRSASLSAGGQLALSSQLSQTGQWRVKRHAAARQQHSAMLVQYKHGVRVPSCCPGITPP
jgi:hypothetical protein|eukprot:COSAG01_NODE_4459_length_5004_cov_24.561060_2_plen_78_part_00